MKLLMYLLEMVSATMKPTLKSVCLMTLIAVDTTLEQISVQNVCVKVSNYFINLFVVNQ